MRQRSYDVEAAAPRIELPKRRQTISLFWLAPLLAALLGLYLVFTFYQKQGPEIEIQFASAEGLVAGKTPIRYRDVNIGVVEEIRLSSNLESVIVTARMTVDSKRYLNEHARFWVVRPRVGTSGVSGLGTLLSGAYIQVNSILGGEAEYSFSGLEEPPLTDEDAPGLRLKLRAKRAGYVGVGSPVYFRQVKVGQIEAQRFQDNYDGVEFTIFIEAPHHKIIRNTTKFWNVSGVDLTVNSRGFKVRSPSLEGLAQGGVSFDLIEEFEFPRSVKDGHVFILHDSKESANETMIQDVSDGYRYVIYFDESVRGLARDAPVEFKGVQIGRVTDIKLTYDAASQSVAVPVYIVVQPERVRDFQAVSGSDREFFNQNIANGLRAKLQTGSLVTGQLFISLDVYDAEQTGPLAKNSKGVSIMPSVGSDLNQVTKGVQEVLAKVNALPIQELVENANSAVSRANVLLGQFEQLALPKRLDNTIGSADSALAEYTKLGKSMQDELTALASQMREFADTADSSMAGIAPDSPLYYNLLNTLKDIQAAARAVLAVSESVEKKPEEFLFGK
ncbi:hypothetical protein AB833_25595 [Chromatiales bacterium (ex Bugula neritina AB1)]|nr:hypothetical protein AB833_25595 [Chromatiales bacterium (ex Bugula neritina AB1)]